MSIDARRGFSLKSETVDPDEMACYEPSHLDLQYLHRYLYWSTWLKELTCLCNVYPNVPHKYGYVGVSIGGGRGGVRILQLYPNLC